MARGSTVDVDAYYRRYGPMVLRRCLQLLRDEELAADCAQDVFVQLVRYSERLHGQAPSSLLNRIATNVCLNRLRTVRPRVADEDAVLAQIAAEDDLEERTLAGRALSFLFRSERESTRVMAVYHYVDGMTHQEIAEEVGLSAEGVRKHLRKLRDRIAAQQEVVDAA